MLLAGWVAVVLGWAGECEGERNSAQDQCFSFGDKLRSKIRFRV
jgi:hypothetical protein